MDDILSIIINMKTLEYMATYKGEADQGSGQELLGLLQDLHDDLKSDTDLKEKIFGNRSSKKHCVLCDSIADLELEAGGCICDNCAQIQGELSEYEEEE